MLYTLTIRFWLFPCPGNEKVRVKGRRHSARHASYARHPGSSWGTPGISPARLYLCFISLGQPAWRRLMGATCCLTSSPHLTSPLSCPGSVPTMVLSPTIHAPMVLVLVPPFPLRLTHTSSLYSCSRGSFLTFVLVQRSVSSTLLYILHIHLFFVDYILFLFSSFLNTIPSTIVRLWPYIRLLLAGCYAVMTISLHLNPTHGSLVNLN